MPKIKCLSKKKVKKLISNGRKNLNFLFQKLDKCKTKIKLILLNKIGWKEESLDMVGDKLNKVVLKEI